MNEKRIYLITHAEVCRQTAEGMWITDPGLSPEGIQRTRQLYDRITKSLSVFPVTEVHAGIGRRHLDTARELGFAPAEIHFSSLWGDSTTTVEINGVCQLLFGHGLFAATDHYHSRQHLERALIPTLLTVPPFALICAGREVPRRLGLPPEECRQAALYEVEIAANQCAIRVLQAGVTISGQADLR